MPSTTPVQLYLLARGQQGLAEPLDTPELREREMVKPSGRNADQVRRLRVGGRELHKLDILRAPLLDNGPSEPARLDYLAQQVASSLVPFARSLPSRTLMFVFGDHGFSLPCSDLGTGPSTEGGASPNEVLVPAHAWLVSPVH